MTTTQLTSGSRFAAGATAAAPVSLLAGVVLMKFGWRNRLDLPWGTAIVNWTLGHLFYVLGYLLLGVALVAMYRLLAQRLDAKPGALAVARVSLGAGLVGTVAMLGQMAVDLRNGFMASSRADMKVLSAEVHAIPELDVLLYGLVPALSMFGLVALVVHLAVERAVAVPAAAAATVGTVLIGTQQTALMVTGGVILCLGMPPIARFILASGDFGTPRGDITGAQ